MSALEALLRDWQGIGVVVRHDALSGAWIFIALHDDTLGSPVGGTRLKEYPDPADGLLDAMRLARGMTHKWAALEFDSGGGKAVICLPANFDPSRRTELLLRYGRLVESLRGAFGTGRDLGTTDEDMQLLASVTRYVHGVDRRQGTVTDPGPYTAAGVLAAMRATASRLGDSDDLTGWTVLLEGVGDVGRPLAHLLAGAGARLMIHDLRPERADSLAAELGGRAVGAEELYGTECDIYAPCAIGATLNRDVIPRLRCRAVVGSANNQLAEDDDALRLHERGILYAPDFIANGGGALAFGLMHRGTRDERTIAARLEGIQQSLEQLYSEAGERGESPLTAAQRRIERTLSRKGSPRFGGVAEETAE